MAQIIVNPVHDIRLDEPKRSQDTEMECIDLENNDEIEPFTLGNNNHLPVPTAPPIEEYCLPCCLFNRQEEGRGMLKCCQCMTWVHPECCGDKPDEHLRDGIYNCSECRLIGKRLSKLEQQLDGMHSLNKELIIMLERSQLECASLREIINNLSQQNQNDELSANTNNIPNSLNVPVIPSKRTESFRICLESSPRRNSIPGKTQVKAQNAPVQATTTCKPCINVIGDSLVRGIGPMISSDLDKFDTVVLSKSGQTLTSAAPTITDTISDMTKDDTLVLQLGTNDISQSSDSQLMRKYNEIIQRVKCDAPDLSVVITALPNQLYPEYENTNHKIDNLNSYLKSVCALDKKFVFLDCTPPVNRSYFKADGVHFNHTGSRYFANCLTSWCKYTLNFPLLSKNQTK